MKKYKVSFKWTVDSWPIILNYVNTYSDISIADMSKDKNNQYCIVVCSHKPTEFESMLYNCKVEEYIN